MITTIIAWSLVATIVNLIALRARRRRVANLFQRSLAVHIANAPPRSALQ